MLSNEIARLLRPFVALDEKRLQQSSTYIDLLLRWNSRVNLTAVRNPQDIVTRHFGESFFVAARLLESGNIQSAIDLGSGAGFPGLPLAMLALELPVTLIESNAKKAAFLREVARSLQLDKVTVFAGRGEEFSGRADVVVMRAVEKFERSVATAAGMVQPGGRLAVMIGKGQLELAKAAVPGFQWGASIEIPGGHSRILSAGTKSINVGRD